MSSAHSPATPRMTTAVRILLCGAAVATVAHGMFTVFGVGKPGLNDIFNEWLYDVVIVAAALACLLRGILVRDDRAAWLMIAAGTWLWAIGDVYWNFKLANLDEIPYPSAADFFYISGYPAFFAGLAMLTHVRLNRFEKGVWLDGLIGALAVSAIGAAFLYPAFQGSTEGNTATVAVNLAYPLGDLLLAAFVVAAVALSGWRPDRSWALLGGGLVGDGVCRWRLPSAGGDDGLRGRVVVRHPVARRRNGDRRGRLDAGRADPAGCLGHAAHARASGAVCARWCRGAALRPLRAGLGPRDLALGSIAPARRRPDGPCIRGEREPASRISVRRHSRIPSPGSETAAGCCATSNGSPARLGAGSGDWSRSSTSTGSRATTTASATSPETCCSRAWARSWRPRLSLMVLPTGSVETSSASSRLSAGRRPRRLPRPRRSHCAKTERRSRSAVRGARCCFPRRRRPGQTPSGLQIAGCTPRKGTAPGLRRAPDDGGPDADAARARTGARNAPRGRGPARGRARSLSRARTARRWMSCPSRSDARRRQDGGSGPDPRQAGPAERPRMGGDPNSHADRGADPGVRACSRPGREAGSLQPRAVGWPRLSRMGSPARTYRSGRGSSRSATPTRRWSRTGRGAVPRIRMPRWPSCANAPGRSSTRVSSTSSAAGSSARSVRRASRRRPLPLV